jgi:AcrR family transcriptional regulator
MSSVGAQKAPAKSRRPRISKDFLDAARRRRLALAAAEVTDEIGGISGVTVADICEAGGHSRVTFYELFTGIASCLRETAAESFEAIFGGVRDASHDDAPWSERTNQAVEGMAVAAAAAPDLARFLLVYARGVDPFRQVAGAEAGIESLAALFASRHGRDVGASIRDDLVARAYVATLTRRLVTHDKGALRTLRRDLEPWALELLGP